MKRALLMVTGGISLALMLAMLVIAVLFSMLYAIGTGLHATAKSFASQLNDEWEIICNGAHAIWQSIRRGDRA